ncbi:hypothetical protein I4U23_019857 [Adineta vaga]|nr:hypothetical protein I4U23_019857 [Adineta vaga]
MFDAKIEMNIYVPFLFIIYPISSIFMPNTSKYDNYGIKIAMNDIFFVQIQNQNDPPRFLIQFAPYEKSSLSSQCLLTFPNATDHYIYSVAVGKNQQQFFFAGELFNDKNGTFIGVAKYNASALSCDTQFSFVVQYFYNYQHQEHFIIDVEPSGRFAYGFANEFMFIFDSLNTSLNVWNANETWLDHSFMPHAVDINDTFGVIAGFIRNPIQTIAVYIPIVYLFNLNSSNYRLFIINYYRPVATPNTWQDLLTNSDADTYSAKYDMSVSINEVGNVLVGMQFINRVFLFSVNKTNIDQLDFVSRYTNGRSLGNGKSVTWLENGIAAILINTYSLQYRWIASEIYFFDTIHHGYLSTTTPLSIFPNSHQILPLRFSSVFLNIVSSSSSLALLDDQGNILIMNPTPRGYFPAVQDIGTAPTFTKAQSCLAGTYKNQSGVHDCILCPSNTKNPGNSSIQCLPCLTGSFCPLGSVTDISVSALAMVIQVNTYPKSPENTKFEDMLVQNTFFIHTCPRIYLSPLFWWFIVFMLGCIIICILAYSGKCFPSSRLFNQRAPVKYCLKCIDLIHEGESVMGGLGTLGIFVSVIIIIWFGALFLKQYPIETTSASYFACDSTIRNAKFETNLQSLSIPVRKDEQTIFDLLNNQSFILNIQFVNTLINCDAISIKELRGSTPETVRWLTCENRNGILTLSVQLSHQRITVQILLEDVKTIGALRIGLVANGTESERFNLKELNFYQSFFKYGQILAQSLPITLHITKVINETLPITGDESMYGGIYIPTFNVDINDLFLSNDQYVRFTLPSTILTIALSETPYYVKNVQQPIVKLSEVAFDSVLFSMGFLEICTIMLVILALPFKAYRKHFVASLLKRSYQRLYKILRSKTTETNGNNLEPCTLYNERPTSSRNDTIKSFCRRLFTLTDRSTQRQHFPLFILGMIILHIITYCLIRINLYGRDRYFDINLPNLFGFFLPCMVPTPDAVRNLTVNSCPRRMYTTKCYYDDALKHICSSFAYPHQLWRLITVNFCHIQWLHLLSNLSIELIQGIPLERKYGSIRIAAVYWLSGLGSSLSFIIEFTSGRAIGASGSLYGLMVFLIVDRLFASFSNNQCRSFPIIQLIVLLVPHLILTIPLIVLYNVAHWAHLSSSLIGFLCSMIMIDCPWLPTSVNRIHQKILRSIAHLPFIGC